MEIVGGVFVLAMVMLAVFIVSHRNERFHRALVDVGEARGLKVRHGGWFGQSRAMGRVDGVELTVDVTIERRGNHSAQVTRVRARGAPPGIRIGRENLMSGVAKAFGAADIVLGDPALDDLAVLSATDERHLRARMDAPTRAAVTDLVSAGGTLDGGTWLLTRRGLIHRPGELLDMIDTVVAAAKAFRAEGVHDDTRSLMRIVETDPVPKVRLEALIALGRAADPEWLERVAAGGADPEVAVVAARALGARGREILEVYLAHPRTSVARFAALSLLQLPDAAAIPGIEGALLRSLEADAADDDVIDILGRIGTAASVPALQAVASAGLGLGARAARARSAVRAIQSRIAVGQGTLALAEDPGRDQAGALSLADAARRRGTLRERG